MLKRLLLLVFIALSFSSYADDVKILSFSPIGEDVAQTNQLVITFQKEQIPLGNFEINSASVGVITLPKIDCEWRWINTNSIACNLNNTSTLKLATKYKVSIPKNAFEKIGLKTLDKDYEYEFITARPVVTSTYQHNWFSGTVPNIIVSFNQPIDQTAVEKNLYFSDPKGNHHPIEAKRNENYTFDESTWFITPKNHLAHETQYTLKIAPGIIGQNGTEAGIEDRDLITFTTFAKPKFLGISCFTNDNDETLVLVSEAANKNKKCNPMRGIAFTFTTPVDFNEVRLKLTSEPNLFGDTNNVTIPEQRQGWYGDHTDPNQKYYVNFYQPLKANAEYNISEKHTGRSIFFKIWNFILNIFGLGEQSEIKDFFGDAITNEVAATFNTDHRKPNYEVGYNHMVLEKDADTETPIYVNNLDELKFAYDKYTASGVMKGQNYSQKVHNEQDVQYAVPFAIRKLLDGKSGAVYGIFSSSPEVKKSQYENTLFAQVTPFYVHAKVGQFNTLVWVTKLADGIPVEGADVKLYTASIKDFSTFQEVIGTAKTNAGGIAILPGNFKADPMLTKRYNYQDESDYLNVIVSKDDDIAILPINHNFKVESWGSKFDGQYYSYGRRAYERTYAWGLTPQGIYKAGDVVPYKIYVRTADLESVAITDQGKYTLTVTDPLGNKVYENADITLDAFGTLSGEIQTSTAGTKGWYEFTLSAEFANNKELSFSYNPLKVLISDFTPSPFKVESKIDAKFAEAGTNMKYRVSAVYYAGGGYANGKVKINYNIFPKEYQFQDDKLKKYVVSSYEPDSIYQADFSKDPVTLDGNGEFVGDIALPEGKVYYGALKLEGAVQDERGKDIANSTSVKYIGVDRFAGIEIGAPFLPAKKPANIKFIVGDENAQIVGDTNLNVVYEYEDIKVAKVKSSGNVYLPQVTKTMLKVKECNLKASDAPVACDFIPENAGTYTVSASLLDTKGRKQTTRVRFDVLGDGYVAWPESDNSIEMIADQKQYKAGDVAKVLVKNPIPGAHALITIGRYGILDSYEHVLANSSELISIPIKENYDPGVYLSVLVMDKRVDKAVENNVDLGKPTFRKGTLLLDVKDDTKHLEFDIKKSKEILKPKEEIQLEITVTNQGKVYNKLTQLAIAVIDEALFDMNKSGLSYYDPYKAFNKLDGMEIDDYSLLTRLVGRQNFAMKGMAAASDGLGAKFDIREIQKFSSYWNPAVVSDASGKATVKFSVPDNLTSWKVLVIGVDSKDKFGLGTSKFTVTKDTEVRLLMPNKVVSGDIFKLGCTIQNRSTSSREMNVSISAKGGLTNPGELLNSTIKLEPYAKTVLYSEVEAAENKGAISVICQAHDNIDGDGISQNLAVDTKYDYTTNVVFGSSTDNFKQKFVFPEGYQESLKLTASPTLITNIVPLFEFAKKYPYGCFEQKLSKALLAIQYKNLSKYIDSTVFVWEDYDKLIADFIAQIPNYQAPNGGMAYFKPIDGFVDPYLSTYALYGFRLLEANGYTVDKTVVSKLEEYVKSLLKQDQFKQYYSFETKNSIRAMAVYALQNNPDVIKAELPRLLDKNNKYGLFGSAILARTLYTNSDSANGKRVIDNIMGAANYVADSVEFTQNNNLFGLILSSGLRDNCMILSTFIKLSDELQDKSVIEKLVNYVNKNLKDIKYINTQEAVYCAIAFNDYASKFEATAPVYNIHAFVNDSLSGEKSFSAFTEKPLVALKQFATNEQKSGEVRFEKKGEGRYYYQVAMTYAEKDNGAKDIDAGFSLRRKYYVLNNEKWTELKSGDTISKGDLILVRFTLYSPAERLNVVVDDPVLAGLEPLNQDLATTSNGAMKSAFAMMTDIDHDNYSGIYLRPGGFYHSEMGFGAVRFYADRLPQGTYNLNYVAQAISSGQFYSAPANAFEMYSPHVFGKTQNMKLNVK